MIDSRGLNAADLGELSGVDPTVIRRFLKGSRGITLETADRIAAALGLRLVEVAARPARSRR